MKGRAVNSQALVLVLGCSGYGVMETGGDVKF